MPPAIAPIPPEQFYRLIVKYGCTLEKEDDFNWVLSHHSTTRPIVIPKDGDLVSVTVMMSVLDVLQISDGAFFDLLRSITDSETPGQ